MTLTMLSDAFTHFLDVIAEWREGHWPSETSDCGGACCRCVIIVDRRERMAQYRAARAARKALPIARLRKE